MIEQFGWPKTDGAGTMSEEMREQALEVLIEVAQTRAPQTPLSAEQLEQAGRDLLRLALQKE